MTVKVPEKNMVDKMLGILGKRCAVYIPNLEKREPYVYAQARKEPVLRALLRPRNAPLPDGWVYIDDLIPTGKKS